MLCDTTVSEGRLPSQILSEIRKSLGSRLEETSDFMLKSLLLSKLPTTSRELLMSQSFLQMSIEDLVKVADMAQQYVKCSDKLKHTKVTTTH